MENASFFDSLFSTSHVFLVGVGIGAFLTYHFLVKKTGPTVHSDVQNKTQEFLNLSSAGFWRDSNPDVSAEQAINRSGRRRSSLYH